MKPGYKETEVGVIPEEWEVKPLGSLADVTKLAGFEYTNYFNSYRDGGEVIVIRGTNITNNKLDLSDTRSIPRATSNKLPRSKLNRKDLVFAYVGTIGPVYLIDQDDKYHLGPNTAKITARDYISPEFLFSYFTSWLAQNEMNEHTSVGAQPSLSMTKIRKFRVIVPPTKTEQDAIAGVLSDVDALIGALDSALAKKRDLKQAAMQQLLTGQKRLPNFHGEWEVATLGEVATVSKGTQLHSSESILNGKFAHLNGGITPSGYTHKTNTPGNTIAISEGGNSCGYVQFLTDPYWCGGHCYSVIPNGIENRFLYHTLKEHQSAIMGLRVGSGLPNVQKTALLAFKLHYPATEAEQTAIAEVLSDMDAELVALEQRRNKTRALKQGMMQELLTGGTRLI